MLWEALLFSGQFGSSHALKNKISSPVFPVVHGDLGYARIDWHWQLPGTEIKNIGQHQRFVVVLAGGAYSLFRSKGMLGVSCLFVYLHADLERLRVKTSTNQVALGYRISRNVLSTIRYVAGFGAEIW